MPFAALDLHKNVVEAILVDDDGRVLARDRFPATREAITQFARQHLSPTTDVALEATTNTWAVVRLLQPFAREVVVSNPLRTRAIAEAKVKTDKVDASVLAHLLRCDFLPRVWIPDEETSELRHLATERASLVADRTRIKNRIHSVLHQRLIPSPHPDLFSAAALAWLEQLEIDAPGRASLDRLLRQLTAIDTEILDLTNLLAKFAHDDQRTKLLMTLPGVDFPVALTLIAVLGDISRFPSADRAASYIGLAPSTRQSGQHCYHGPITKQGSGHARWMMVQAAQALATHPGPLGVFFRKLAKRKNRNVAIVATARKLVTIAWHMLTRNEPYRYAQPDTLAAKFNRLRIRVTGQRKVGGNPKGSPRPAAYGTGKPTRAVPSLHEVYRDAGLPDPAPLSTGELRTVEAADATAFARAIRQSHRVARRHA